MENKLNQNQLEEISSIALKLLKLHDIYENSDIELQNINNGTVLSNIDAALSNLGKILQEYYKI